MKKKRLIIACFVVALGGLATGVAGETLQEVVQKTLATNPEVMTTVSERLARDQALLGARSAYHPSIDLTAGIGRESSRNASARSAGDNGRTLTRKESALTLRQMVFDGFETSNEVARQSARVNSAAYEVFSTSEQIALNASEVYLNVLRHQELLALARENLEFHQQTYDQIKLRSSSGVGRMADLDQVTARLALAMSNVLSEEANLQDARTNYLRVTGDLPQALATPDDGSLAIPPTLDEAIGKAIEGHPELKVAEADVEAAQAQHRAARSPLYPRLDLEVGGSWNRNLDGQNGKDYDNSVMLRMQYNLFRGGGDEARIKETAYLTDEAREIRNRTHREVVESMRLAWIQYRSLDDRLNYLSQHMESSRATLEAYKKQFNIGKRSLLDLLDSEIELFQSSRSYLNGKYDRWFALYRVQAGMGNLVASLKLLLPTQADAN